MSEYKWPEPCRHGQYKRHYLPADEGPMGTACNGPEWDKMMEERKKKKVADE